jgi:hypothetical protein
MHQSTRLASARTGIDQKWSAVPCRRDCLAIIQHVSVARSRRLGRTQRWQEKSADCLVHYQIRWQSQFASDLRRPTPPVNEFRSKPVGRTQELSRKYVSLDFLAFTRGITLNSSCSAVDRVTTQARRSDGNFIHGIAMELVVTDLVSDDNQFVGRGLMRGNVDQS